MIETDDDLPVLTQILRTGTAATVTLIRGEANGDRAEAHPPPDHDEAPHDAPLLADELVIGHDADGGSTTTGPDAFALPQDHAHEPHHDHSNARSFTFDEPDFVVAPAAPAEPLSHRPFDVDGALPAFDVAPIQVEPAVAPEPVEDPAALALRIRDVVLDDLLTRIGPELDARIAQALHAEVETALARLQYDLRNHLTDALRDVVTRAVTDAVADGSADPVRPAGPPASEADPP